MTRLRAVLLSSLASLLVLGALTLPVGPASATYWAPTVTPKGESIKENAGRARVILTVKAKAKKTLRIPFKTVAGTAKPGRDYRTTKGSAVLKKGTRQTSIWIPLINDKTPEATERFTVKLTDGATYNLKAKSVTVTILDDDKVVVNRWSGDITVHVTQHQVMNPTIVDEDWTFVAHLVLAPDQYRTSWFPTSASSWTLSGNHTSSDPTGDCAAHPDHQDFDTTGNFMADPLSGYPQTGKAQYWLKSAAGSAPYVMEAGPISTSTIYHSWAYYSGSCHESVGDGSLSVVFQTQWRTSNPVGHPGTFPFTFHGGADPTLTVDFTDTYSQQSGWTTHSRVTGTLHAS